MTKRIFRAILSVSLAAVLVWLMQCLTVMTMDAGIHTRVKVPLPA